MTRVMAPFVMAIPPGWTRFPARPEDRADLEAIVDAVVKNSSAASAPRDSSTPFIERARRQLLDTVGQAGENGAIAVYLPTTSVDGFMPPVSLIESEVHDEAEDTPEVVVGRLLSESGQLERSNPDKVTSSGVRDIDGALAARIEDAHSRVRTLTGVPDLDNRQVTYTINAPHHRAVWVVLSYSVVADPDSDSQIVTALVTLFDALVSTLRWVHVPEQAPSNFDLRLHDIAEARL